MKKHYHQKTICLPIIAVSNIRLILYLCSFFFILSTNKLFGQTQDVFNANGTWTTPNCVTTATVEVWGAGGGGAESNNILTPGGGGGGGGYSVSVITLTPGTNYSITVGKGGAGGTLLAGNGGAGGNTWFGSATTVQANGGGGGTTLGAGAGAAAGTGTIKNAGSNGSGATGGNAGGATGGTGGGSGSAGNSPGGGGGGGGITSGGSGADGQVTITYKFNPSVAVTSQPFICPGNSTTLTAINATSYTWTPGGANTASIVVSPASTTSYTVTGTSTGCIGTAVSKVTVYSSTISVNSTTMCQGDVPTLTASPAVSYLWAPGGETTASINVSPNSTTTYTVTGTGCGFTSSAVSTVSVNCPPQPCPNASFGTCNFTGWSATYCASGGYPYPFRTKGFRLAAANAASNSSPETNHAIMTSGFDPVVGGNKLAVKDPLGGSCSARLGNNIAQGGGESLMYKYVVKASSTSFTYDYAVVLSSGPHNTCQQPYFKIRMWAYNSPTDSVPISCGTYDVDANTAASIPGFTQLAGTNPTIYYSTWNTVTIPLNAYVGQTVSIQFVTRDCCPNCNQPGLPTAADGGCSGSSGGAHFCYAYIDTRCQSSQIVASLACTGNATLTAPGGAATYSWKGPGVVSGGTSATAVVNATGTYTVTMTTYGNSPCTYSLTYNITVINGVTVSVNSSTVCQGGQAILTATGSNISTYLWAPGGETTASIYVSPNSTTTYSVTGTSSAGCSATKTGTVTVNTAPVVTVNPATICTGGTATLTASGGSSYSWSTGETTASIIVSPTSTKSYSVTSTINGATCPGIGTATITVNSIPVVTVNSTTICNGQSATLTASGANTYLWANGATTNSITHSPASTSTYSVTGTTLGCTGMSTATITVNPIPVVTASSTSICNGLSATINAGGANSYKWNTGATTNTLTDSPTSTTSYTVIGNSLGCLDTATSTIQVVYAPVVTVTPDTICVGNTTTLTATGATGYSWSTGQTINPITVTPASTTTYTVSGTGCPNTTTVTVTVNPIPVVTCNSQTICAGSSTILTATGADNYTWSTGATGATLTDSPLTTTSYTVTGNSLGCISTATGTITTNIAPILTATSSTICIGKSATLNVSGADTYTWSATGGNGTSMTASPTTTTTYTIHGNTAGITCVGTTTATITVNPLPIVSASSTTICNNQGPAGTITASGADTYLWNTGETTASITHSPSNTTTYSVTGTTIYGCIGTASGTIVVNPIPMVTATSTTICIGLTSTLTVSGADSYSWNTGSLTNTMSDTPSSTTTYTVTGTTLGCYSSGTGTITVNPLPTPVSTSATICKGQSATLTASGANSFIWSEGTIGANMTASPTSTTTYTVTGNSLSCTATAVGTIKVNPIPVITVVPSTVCAGTVGSLTASGANSYVWNTGATSATLATTPLTTTGYTVTGTSLGCSSTGTGTITVNPIPTLSVTNTTICRGQSGTITASTATPGTASYSWATGASTASLTLSPTYTSVYNVTVSIKGCTKSASGTITVLIAPIVVVTPQTICAGQVSTITAYGAKSYTWSTGETINPIHVSPPVPGATYSVVGLGCPNNATGKVTVNPNPVISATSATVCQGISATIQVKGANSYMWTTGDATSQISDAPQHTTTYSVVGTSLGCNDTTTGIITVNPNPKIKVNNDTICPGDFGKLTASGANSYFWTTGSRSNTIQMSPPLTTTYTVTGTTNAGCVGDGTGTIYVSKFPTADFVISPNPTTVFNTEIAFTNKSSVDVVYWHWDFGDGKTLYPNTASPLHTYAAEVGTYTITLIVHNITPCWDTIDYQLYVGPEYAFYIPNCFTPNGDIHNEGFRGRGIGIEQYKLQIFDRWGLNIWQSTNLDESWDGKIKGYDNLVQQDVYVWKVFILDVFGKEHSYVGTVTVLR